MSKKLDELLERQVAIIDCETGKIKNITTVDQITDGFELYIMEIDNEFQLLDFQDEDYSYSLGETIEEALHQLSKFIEYFNNLDDGDESWESDFMYSVNKAENV